MPTMKSLRLDPHIRDLLENLGSRTSAATTTNNNNNGHDNCTPQETIVDYHQSNQFSPSKRKAVDGYAIAEQPPSQPHTTNHHNNPTTATTTNNTSTKNNVGGGMVVLPIHTPQALLSRDPHQLCKGLHSNNDDDNVPLQQVLNLRAQIADAVIASNEVGKHANEIASRVNSLMKVRYDNDKDDENNTIAVSNNDDANNSQKQNCFHRPPPLFTGASTALDLCLYQQSLLSSSSTKDQTAQSDAVLYHDAQHTNAISTGSHALDTLLSPPKEHTQQLHRVMQSATKTTTLDNSHDINNYDNNNNNSIGGVSFGIVTEVVGTPSSGKTQLALTLASRAVLSGMRVYYLAAGGNSAVLPLARRMARIVSCLWEKEKSGVGDEGVGTKRRRGGASLLSNTLLMEILQKIEFTTVPDGYHALAAISKLNTTTSTSTQKRLLILDSASGCLSPNFLGSHTNYDGGVGTGLVNEVAIMLKRLARLHHYAIFVTNGMVGSSTTTTSNNVTSGFQPALGTMWRAADVRICLNVLEIGHHHQNNDHCNDSSSRPHPLIRKVRANLIHHYAKSCGLQNGISGTTTDIGMKKKLDVEFAIDSCGVVNV